MPLERTNPSTMAKPGGFNHVVKSGDTIYIAGQVGRKADGSLAGPDITSQTEQVFANLNAALAAAGASMKDVVKTTVFLTHRDDIAGYRAVRDRVVATSDRPASTLCIIDGLAQPEFRVEVEAIAVLS